MRQRVRSAGFRRTMGRVWLRVLDRDGFLRSDEVVNEGNFRFQAECTTKLKS